MITADKVQTGDSTAGTSTSTTYTYSNSSYNAEKGWECPRCGRINAPWVRQCDCSARKYTITCDDTTAGDDWWKKYVTCDSDTFRIHPESGSIWKAPSSICGWDSTTTVKSDPNIVVTATNNVVGGSDYWDNTEKIWSNILKNVSNMKEIY